MARLKNKPIPEAAIFLSIQDRWSEFIKVSNCTRSLPKMVVALTLGGLMR
jgi:hypothetical protein